MFQGALDIDGAAPFTEATLNRREQFIFLQVPDQSVVIIRSMILQMQLVRAIGQ